jgi:hypothetical protein
MTHSSCLFSFRKNPNKQRRLEEYIGWVTNTIGVVCFSEDWLDPVLWSHYAAKHAGIALGFDISQRVLLPVTYKKDRMEFPSNPEEDDVDRFLGTKFESWRYEREHRVAVRLADASVDGGLLFENFGPDVVLREVILGPLCSEDVAIVRAKVDAIHSSVTTFKSRLAQKFFSVVPDETTVPPRG